LTDGCKHCASYILKSQTYGTHSQSDYKQVVKYEFVQIWKTPAGTYFKNAHHIHKLKITFYTVLYGIPNNGIQILMYHFPKTNGLYMILITKAEEMQLPSAEELYLVLLASLQ